MKKVLFIDRDGTLIQEPVEDQQVDSLDKLEFMPYVFNALYEICQKTEYELVMVTNQDGLGTASFPEDSFWPAHNKMLNAFSNEGILFKDVCIDRSFEKDNSPSRKPGTAMLNKYIYGDYDMANSFVIGDRASDVQLAQNLGCKSIFYSETTLKSADFTSSSWKDIARILCSQERTASIERMTNETSIKISINLDNNEISDIDTGLKFLDHMLCQISRHGNLGLMVKVKGDLEVDEHHTIEDTAIAIGQALDKALGGRKGVSRYAFVLPMDDSLAQVAIDLGGRPWLNWNVDFKREYIGDVPTEMFMHFFKSFSDAARCNIDVRCEGDNEHHKIESIFKAFAKCLGSATAFSGDYNLPSTKGLI